MSDTTSAAKQTLEMSVANTGFIVERLGRDCSPLQYLRELTQNSIEAILETSEKRGEIHWDVDWDHFDLTGHYKLCITDTGVGMTGDEMLRYINQLSSSSHEQAHDANFGVGAKVAAATRNPHGLIYLSWKDRQGWMTHLWRDPETDQYGLARRPRDDGRYSDFSRITDDVKPDVIGAHGTKVVLMGDDDEHNTVDPPAGIDGGRQRWIQKYLDTRYFRFPEGIDVKVREAYQAPRNDPHRNMLKPVYGQNWLLDSESTWHGTVRLSGATAHAWILGADVAKKNYGDRFASSGHMAALYRDELYEMVTGRGGVARLQLFGVIFGHNRVVIYVDPDEDPRLSSNTARTQLLIDGEPLPWAEWAAEFRAAMPQPIADLMEEITGGSTSTDHKQAIRERLKQIRDLLTNPSRYRRTRDGHVNVSDSTVGGAPRNKDEDATSDGGSRSGSRGGRAGGIYALFVDDDGDPADEVFVDPLPDVKWISERHDPPTRTFDLLEDRAAKYMPDQNLLQINADFRVITDLVNRWCDFYGDVPGARTTVEEVVHEWFEQALIETVVGAQALKGSPQWTLDDLARLWSEEGLTSAVLQRYHIDVNVRRTLGSKLGSLREKVAA